MIARDLADKLTRIALQQVFAARQLKKPRMDTIKEIEDVYANRHSATLFGRIDIPLPFLAGHMDTVLAKIDTKPSVTFIPTEEADIEMSEKVTAVWKLKSTSMQDAWARKDRNEKKLAILSGRGIAKIFADSIDGKYRSHYEVVDHNDFLCEGTQGHLEDQMYHGQENIFRVPAEVREKAKSGAYDEENAIRVINAASTDEFLTGQQELLNKFNRMKALGLDPMNSTYIGQPVINFIEWVMEYEGERYYLVFNEQTGIWVRAEKLRDVFPCGDSFPRGISPWVSWATHEDAFNFWSKGFGDDVLPIAQAIRIIMNQAVINMMRRNQPTKAFDPSVFPDPNKLEWQRPDQLVPINVGKDPSKGIYTFETPEITGSLDLTKYLDDYVGKWTGVTAEAQGGSDKDAKVGVYYGQLQQVADRIGSVEKAYNESYAEKGYRFFWGLRTHVNEALLIKMIGKQGVKWDELTRGELQEASDFDVQVSGGRAEAELDAVKQERQANAITQLTSNPKTAEILSAHFLVENTLKIAGFNDEDLVRAFDNSDDGDRQLMDEASRSIQQILEGKTPRLNRGANARFIEKIVNFAYDNLDYIKLDRNGQQTGIIQKVKTQYDALIAYANAHYEIAVTNSIRKAQEKAMTEREAAYSKQVQSGQVPGQGADGIQMQPGDTKSTMQDIAAPDQGAEAAATAGTLPGTAQRSQELSASMTPGGSQPVMA
jgi:hypothetical protein